MEFYKQTFDSTSNLPAHWAHQEFEQCIFRKLNLSALVLSGANFINCRFEDCNLTKVPFVNTKLDDVFFSGCNLTYVDFSLTSTFGFRINCKACKLDYSVFVNRNFKKLHFEDCSIQEAHFLTCDLTGSVFKNCNLDLAKFNQNNLSQADFSSSYNLTLNPDDNKLKKAKFSLYNLPGLLMKYDIVIDTVI